MKKIKTVYVCLIALVMPYVVCAQSGWVETEYYEYDFEQDGIYYKFAPAPDGSYIDTSYKDSEGNIVKDGFYTGLEKENGDILWITGKSLSASFWYNEYKAIPGPECKDVFNSSYSGDVYIPDSVQYNGKKYPVKGLAKEAFQFSFSFGDVYLDGKKIFDRITSVRLPETLEYIAQEAFYLCDSSFPLEKLPKGLKYIGKDAFVFYDGTPEFMNEIPDDVLYLGVQYDNSLIINFTHYKYPKNAVYAGQINPATDKITYPLKMQHLIYGDVQSKPQEMVIPDNGTFYVHQYGLPQNVTTVFSYAPIMKNCRPGYGFRTLKNVYKDISFQYEKTLYVLPGLKEAYAQEWQELLAGEPYTKDGVISYFEEDHIIEVSREEMDAMVEAAGLTVPTPIHEVEVSPSKKVEETIYTLDGRRWSTFQKGVNIVRQSDGSTKKVYVK